MNKDVEQQDAKQEDKDFEQWFGNLMFDTYINKEEIARLAWKRSREFYKSKP